MMIGLFALSVIRYNVSNDASNGLGHPPKGLFGSL